MIICSVPGWDSKPLELQAYSSVTLHEYTRNQNIETHKIFSRLFHLPTRSSRLPSQGLFLPQLETVRFHDGLDLSLQSSSIHHV